LTLPSKADYGSGRTLRIFSPEKGSLCVGRGLSPGPLQVFFSFAFPQESASKLAWRTPRVCYPHTRFFRAPPLFWSQGLVLRLDSPLRGACRLTSPRRWLGSLPPTTFPFPSHNKESAVFSRWITENKGRTLRKCFFFSLASGIGHLLHFPVFFSVPLFFLLGLLRQGFPPHGTPPPLTCFKGSFFARPFFSFVFFFFPCHPPPPSKIFSFNDPSERGHPRGERSPLGGYCSFFFILLSLLARFRVFFFFFPVSLNRAWGLKAMDRPNPPTRSPPSFPQCFPPRSLFYL